MGSLSSPSPLSRSLGHIYVAFRSKEPDVGGNFTNSISRFDPVDNTWSHVTSIPGLPSNHVLRDFEMACVGNSIYVVGGRLCRKDRVEQNGLSNNGSGMFHETDVEVLSSLLRYNIESNEWSHCAPLSLQRYNFACTVSDSKIYVAGGQFEVGNAKGTSQAEVYEPTTNTWTNLPNMRRLRCKCVGVTWQNKVHVIGGFIEGCDPNQPIANLDRCSAEVYDVERAEWDLKPRMWQLDVPPHQIVAVGDRLFSCGDCLNVCKGHLDVYDGKMNMWDIVEGPGNVIVDDCVQVVQKTYATMAPIGQFLFFFVGGKIVIKDAPSTYSMVYKFNTSCENRGWTVFEPFREEEERELCCNCCVSTHS